MPWKETSPVRERSEFIVEHRSGLYSFSTLCEKYQISRRPATRSSIVSRSRGSKVRATDPELPRILRINCPPPSSICS